MKYLDAWWLNLYLLLWLLYTMVPCLMSNFFFFPLLSLIEKAGLLQENKMKEKRQSLLVWAQ